MKLRTYIATALLGLALSMVASSSEALSASNHAQAGRSAQGVNVHVALSENIQD